MEWIYKCKLFCSRYAFLEGSLRFLIVLLLVHLFWKYGIVEDSDLSGHEMVTLGAWNLTALFTRAVQGIVAGVMWMFHTFTSREPWVEGLSTLHFIGVRGSIHIVWSCSGLKQMLVFTLIIVFAKGPWQHKCWFIPLMDVCIYLLNILRVFWLSLYYLNNPALMDTMHEGGKYIFYVILFLMWVLWDQCFAGVSCRQKIGG